MLGCRLSIAWISVYMYMYMYVCMYICIYLCILYIHCTLDEMEFVEVRCDGSKE
jgi:hypothetical protein